MSASFPGRGGPLASGVMAWVLVATTLGLGQTQAPGDYGVGPQDVLRITVFDKPDLTGAFTADADVTYVDLRDIQTGRLSTVALPTAARSSCPAPRRSS